MSFKIELITAFVMVDPDTGDEGIIGVRDPGGTGWVPLVAADEARVTSFMELARTVAAQTGRTVRLVRFSSREVVDTILPPKGTN